MTSLQERTDIEGQERSRPAVASTPGRHRRPADPRPAPGRHRRAEPFDPPTVAVPVEPATAPVAVDPPTAPVALDPPTAPIALDPPTAPITVNRAVPVAVDQPTTPIWMDATTAVLPVVAPVPRTLGRPAWAWAVVVAAAALGVRLTGLMTANDLFIDEVTYGNLAALVADGRPPSIFGVPFFLHPPGGLLPDALAIRMAGITGPAMDRALELRWVHAALGAAVVVLGQAVLRRVTRPAVALVAAGVLAFDPFMLRIDTRVMLETSMTLWLLAGLPALVAATTAPPGRRRVVAEVAAGLLLGFAVFTKDVAVIPVAAVLVLALAFRTLRPASVLRVAVALPLPYLAYLGLVASAGLLPAWSAEKLDGLERLVGHRQVTGFNMSGAPSLLPRLAAQLARFGTSYVLIGCCLAAGLLVALRGRTPGRRLIGYLAVGEGVLGGYAAAVGTLEEQFGYVVVVTSVLAVAIAADELCDRPRWRRGVAALSLVFLAVTAVTGVRARLVTDDGFRQVRAWMQTSLPPGSRVGLTGLTAEFALVPHDGWGVWPSLTSLAGNDAEYVMTQSATLSQRYGYSSPELLTWLAAHAEPVYRFTGPTNGDTTVWWLDRAAVRAAVARGETLPPVAGGYP